MAELRVEIKKDMEYLIKKITNIRGSVSPLSQEPVPLDLYQKLGLLHYALQTSPQRVLSTVVDNYASLEKADNPVV